MIFISDILSSSSAGQLLQLSINSLLLFGLEQVRPHYNKLVDLLSHLNQFNKLVLKCGVLTYIYVYIYK